MKIRDQRQRVAHRSSQRNVSCVASDTFVHLSNQENMMRLWGAIPALAIVAGAVASPSANAENLVGKIIDHFKNEVRDELRDLKHGDHGDHDGMKDYKHIVVIYQENHSFDNLYGH